MVLFSRCGSCTLTWSPSFVEMVHDLLEHAPLLAPIDRLTTGRRVLSVRPFRFKRKRIRSWISGARSSSFNNLRHAGSRHSPESGQLGIIPKLRRP